MNYIDPKCHDRASAGHLHRSRSRLHHGLGPRPEPHDACDPGHHHAARRPLSFPGRSGGGNARVHLPPHQRRRGNRVLDRESRLVRKPPSSSASSARTFRSPRTS